MDQEEVWDNATRIGTNAGYNRNYYQKIDLGSLSELRRPFVINTSQNLFGSKIESLVRVPFVNLIEELLKENKYINKDPNSDLAKNGPFKKIILYCTDKTNNNKYTVIAYNQSGWKVFDSNQKVVEFSNDRNDILLITKEGFIRSQGWGNVKNSILAFLIAKGVDRETAQKMADSIAGGLEGAEEALKGLRGNAKVAQMKEPAVVYQPGVKGQRDLTRRIQACLVRFAGGNDTDDPKLKPYDLNSNAPGFSVWSGTFGNKGPILKKKFDDYYDDKMLRVVKTLRDSINKYNKEKLDLDNAPAVEKMLNQIKDANGGWIIYQTILKSPACEDTLVLREGKNPMVKDFEFLSNKNKKIHSMLMEQVKKIKEDK